MTRLNRFFLGLLCSACTRGSDPVLVASQPNLFDRCATESLPKDAGLTLLHETLGKGELAADGRLAYVRFEVTRDDGGIVTTTLDAGVFGLIVGGNHAMPGLETAVRCMRPGGQREVEGLASALFDSQVVEATQTMHLFIKVEDVLFVIEPEHSAKPNGRVPH